ncbi:Hsp20/alpha crystallin family protein [Tabrizicola sp. WMC-M-20]|nr:Hsp20/alpha crystallin family protein [Tabrizicola sp. WMC-M-20]
MARNPLAPFSTGSVLGRADPLTLLHREMNRLFEDVYRDVPAEDQTAGALRRIVGASMNVSETEAAYRVTTELPGVKEEDIEIRLDEDVLTIRGEKKFERHEGDEKENFHFTERAYGSFQRSMRLPTPVDPDKIEASCDSGVLTITLPKTERAERSRRIQLGKGGGQIEGQKTQKNEDAQQQTKTAEDGAPVSPTT